MCLEDPIVSPNTLWYGPWAGSLGKQLSSQIGRSLSHGSFSPLLLPLSTPPWSFPPLLLLPSIPLGVPRFPSQISLAHSCAQYPQGTFDRSTLITVRIRSTVLTQPGTPVSFRGMFIRSLFNFRKLWIFCQGHSSPRRSRGS